MLRNIFFIFILNFILLNVVFGDFIIKEIFPNTNNDSELEYIIIENSFNGDLDIGGYSILDKSGKEYIFDEYIYGENEQKKYLRSESKILLNNSNEELYLKNENHELVDSWIYDDTIKGYIYYRDGIDINYKIYEEEEEEEEENFLIENEITTDKLDNILFSFQNPSYLLERDFNIESFGTGEFIYNCDKSYDECKVNFDFRDSFIDGFNESDFNCEITFGSGFITGEENKCNPSTVIFPLGTYEIDVKIIDNLYSEKFIEMNLFIINNEVSEVEDQGIIEEDNRRSRNHIPTPKIEVQSGIEKAYSRVYKNYYTCNKKECSVNLNYDGLDNRIYCKWKFYDGVYSDGTEKKCNPGYVKYGPGLHKVKLIVFDEYYSDNKETLTFYIDNLYEAEELNSNISIQGVIGKNKIKIANTIFCTNSDICSINFTGLDSTGEISKYEWNFGSGMIFQGENPKSQYFNLGNNKVSLAITDYDGNVDIKYFNIIVMDRDITNKEIKYTILNNKTLLSLDRNKIILNDFIDNNLIKKDEVSFIIKDKLLNNFTQTLRNNKNSITIYGKTNPGSILFIENKGNDLIFTKNDEYILRADDEGKYSLNIKNTSLGNFKTSTYILDNNLGKISTGVNKEYYVDYINEEKQKIKEVINDSIVDNTKDKDLIYIKEKSYIKIDVQGKIGTNKILNGNHITCIKTCSINFTAINSKGIFVEYNWSFGNGESFNGINPGYIKYKNFGNYIMELDATDGYGEVYIEKFYITFIEKLINNNSIINDDLKIDNKLVDYEYDTNKYLTDNMESPKNNINIIIFIVLLILSLGVILLKKEKIL